MKSRRSYNKSRKSYHYGKPLALTLILILIFGFSIGCQKQEPLKLGFAGGLTGKNASVAISARDAILLAVEEVNQSGGLLGRSVELIIKDDLDQETTTATVDNELIDAGVPVIFGHYMSQLAEASVTATEGKDVLLVSPTISTYELTGKDDHFIRLIVENTRQGAAMAEQALEDGNAKSVLVYNEMNQEFVQGVANSYKERFSAGGGEIIDAYKIGERDGKAMEQIILKAKADGVDSFMLIMSAGDVAMFAQLLNRNDMKPGLYSSTWGMTADVIREGGETVEGIHFPALFNPTDTSAGFMKFRENYLKAYATEPDFAAVYSYESAQVVFSAIRAIGSDKADDIKGWIIKQKDFEGMQGKISIDTFGDVTRTQFVVVVKDGKFVVLGK